ncbi:MAG: hypothetical protein AB1736_14270 [Chloroflexota bacterium]
MAVVHGGEQGSGLDRALGQALRAELDDILESGELFPGERELFPEPYGPYDPDARPWQMPFATPRTPPATAEPILWMGARSRAGSSMAAAPAAEPPATDAAPTVGAASAPGAAPAPAGAASAPGAAPAPAPGPAAAPAPVPTPQVAARSSVPNVPPPHAATETERNAARRSWCETLPKGKEADRQAAPERLDFQFRDDLTGVVMVHGVGRQLAGETLLNWTGSMITVLADAARADALRPPADRRLKPLAKPPRPVSDPVFRSSIDFSGETFPVVQLRIPGRTDVPDADPRSNERRWLVTETWWAAQVRPQTLGDMIDWLGQEGGLGRILQGLQEHMLGRGILGWAARVSLQALVSVVVAVGMLVFAVLLALTKVVPFGLLKDFVALQLAASQLTGNFGGARTLLRDPAQSANVRGRLVATIKALRAYGCRRIVVIGHSGGTMVSLQTLTDPAYPRLKVDKLITHGEALNLAWRLESEEQDLERPRLPRDHRMAGDLAIAQPHLLWRDFWATHDPASSGPPVLPEGMTDAGAPRFLAERVYNRMRISEDHNVFWANDEHFVMPLIREIDAATTDRSTSAFYSDAAESAVRARRKERVAILGLWRRASLALPVMGILAALLVSSGGGRLPDAAGAALSVWQRLPFHDALAGLGRSLNALGDAQISSLLPDALTWDRWYGLGLFVLQALFLVALVFVVVPGRPDRLWLGRPRARQVLLAVDLILGIGALVGIGLAWAFTTPAGPITALANLVTGSAVGGVIVLLLVMVGIGRAGTVVRRRIRELEGSTEVGDRVLRDVLVVASAVFLALVVFALVAAIVGIVLVLAGNAAIPESDTNRDLVLGAIVALAAFQVLQLLGIWRWDSWDVRERRALRRRPLDYPNRGWVYLLAVVLASIALVAGLAIPSGPDWPIPLLDDGGWLTVLGILVPVVVVLSVGKDVVDNDLDLGEPLGVVPEATGPAAGEKGS